jgi:Flp pilus assembly protein TadG
MVDLRHDNGPWSAPGPARGWNRASSSVSARAVDAPSRRKARAGSRLGQLGQSRGQALIELALVIPVLFLLVFGIIDFGVIFYNVSGMRAGLNSAGNEAAIGQFGSNSSCTLTGAGSASVDDKDLMCLVHSLDGINNDSTTRVDIVVGNTSSSSYAVGSQVTICEEYAISSASGYLTSILSGHVATATQTVEVATANSSGLSSAQETALSSSSWGFCSTPAPA